MCVLISVTLMGALFAQDSFFDNADENSDTFTNADSDNTLISDSAKSEKTLEWHGFAKLDARLWVHPDVKRTDAIPVFGLTVSHSNAKTELSADLQLNVRTVKDYPLDILNELTMRAYLGDCVLSAGKLKLVWGKGDMIHVLDVFNANDLTDFTIPAYIDRRIGEPMVHFAYNAPIPLRLELAWAPSMTPDRVALSGPWVPPQIMTVQTKAKTLAESYIEKFSQAALLPNITVPSADKLYDSLYDPIERTAKALYESIDPSAFPSEIPLSALLKDTDFRQFTQTVQSAIGEDAKLIAELQQGIGTNKKAIKGLLIKKRDDAKTAWENIPGGLLHAVDKRVAEEKYKTLKELVDSIDAYENSTVYNALLATVGKIARLPDNGEVVKLLKDPASLLSSVIVKLPDEAKRQIIELIKKAAPPEKIAEIIARNTADALAGFLKTESELITKELTETVAAYKRQAITAAHFAVNNAPLNPLTKLGVDTFLPDMHNIKYGQYGIRLSGSAGPVDMAGQYYFGCYKTPSIDVEGMVTNALAGKSLAGCVHYDPVHIFGIDFGAAIAMFNFKSEFAYYMTHDFKGADPAVHNNSIQWVMGFDVDIPLNNINVNIQNLGAWTLGFKKVKENNENGKFDMDWNTAEKSTNNKLIVNISDSWLHENLTDSVTCIWGIEHNDFVVMPKLRYRIKDELYVEGTGAYIYAANKKSEFSNWKNNHFVQVSLEYRF